MLFNIHHGQMRFSSIPTGSKPMFRNKSPKKMLMMAHIKGGHQGVYRADKLGNIDVVAPAHIDVMVGLGYPIYDGDGKMNPVPKDDLIYPNLYMDSTYWRKINQAKNLGRD
ncbi:hypothetical protein ES703_106805 [subsurface metagenome]